MKLTRRVDSFWWLVQTCLVVIVRDRHRSREVIRMWFGMQDRVCVPNFNHKPQAYCWAFLSSYGSVSYVYYVCVCMSRNMYLTHPEPEPEPTTCFDLTWESERSGISMRLSQWLNYDVLIKNLFNIYLLHSTFVSITDTHTHTRVYTHTHTQIKLQTLHRLSLYAASYKYYDRPNPNPYPNQKLSAF